MSNRIRFVFILGITPRCGTNYLQDLLCLNPSFVPTKIHEDYLWKHIGLLERYMEEVSRSRGSLEVVGNDVWRRASDLKLRFGASLALHLLQGGGEGESRPPSGGFIVCKTPDTKNFHLIREYMPEALVLLLVRDPRDVAISTRKSFGTSEMKTYDKWYRRGLDLIKLNHNLRKGVCLVRYEDAVLDRKGTIKKIYDNWNLWDQISHEGADYNKEILVRGSSDLTLSGELHWNPVKMPSDWNPIGRYQRERQYRIAVPEKLKELMLAFGYA